MHISDLAKQARQFHLRTYMIARKYGQLNHIVARYFQLPKRGQTTGLPINLRQTAESRQASNPTVLKNQGQWEISNARIDTIEPANTEPGVHHFPALPIILPTLLRKNSTWEAATLLPSSAKFDSNQGNFIPFTSKVQSLRQSDARNKPLTATGEVPLTNPSRPNPILGDLTARSEPSPSVPVQSASQKKPEQPPRALVQVMSVPKLLLGAATGLPLIPLALARASTGSSSPTSIITPAQKPSPNTVLGGLSINQRDQTIPPPNVPAQSASRTSLAGLFSLPLHASNAAPIVAGVLQPQVQSIPILGLNRTVTGRTFFNLARANRLQESTFSLPPVPIGGVHTPIPSTDTQQNLSQIVTAYAETESSQARSQLTYRKISRNAQPPRLPTNQPLGIGHSSSSSANFLGTISTELPTITSSDARTTAPMAATAGALPRLSDLEAQNFELGESDDVIAMDELRTRISKILAEEIRRHLPGE